MLTSHPYRHRQLFCPAQHPCLYPCSLSYPSQLCRLRRSRLLLLRPLPHLFYSLPPPRLPRRHYLFWRKIPKRRFKLSVLQEVASQPRKRKKVHAASKEWDDFASKFFIFYSICLKCNIYIGIFLKNLREFIRFY